MPKTSELPADLDPAELNERIRDLGQEMGVPYRVNPDLVELGEIPQHVYGYNRGCRPDGLEQYKEGQRWRRKLIAELKRRPEWIAEWRAEREMDRRVEELCRQKGLTFQPWECPPWRVGAHEELPPRHGTDGIWDESRRLAQRLRRELETELAEEDAAQACRAGYRPRPAGLRKGLS